MTHRTHILSNAACFFPEFYRNILYKIDTFDEQQKCVRCSLNNHWCIVKVPLHRRYPLIGGSVHGMYYCMYQVLSITKENGSNTPSHQLFRNYNYCITNSTIISCFKNANLFIQRNKLTQSRYYSLNVDMKIHEFHSE